MKKLIITCALLTCGTIVSFAQNTSQPAPTTATLNAQARPMPPRPGGMPVMTVEQKAERRSRSEEKQLGLSPEQYKKVYDANLEMTKKVEELKASGKQPQRSDFEALSKANEDKLATILTPEQQEKYKLMMNRQHAAPAPNNAAPGIPAPTMSR